MFQIDDFAPFFTALKDKITFHAKLNKDDKNPDHTLVFIKKDNKLIMGYSRPRPNTPDSFNRALGLVEAQYKALLVYCRDNMLSNTNKKPRNVVSIQKEKVEKTLLKVMPKAILSVLPHYIGRAKKYFKIEGDATIQLRGDSRDNRVFEFQM